ncbi:MAG: hypothetical protein IKL47_01805, partial [Clostridia bacterium]|nr:hypothetical protein [Clostridia bacterium]
MSQLPFWSFLCSFSIFNFFNPTTFREEAKYKYYFNDADGTEHYFYFESIDATEGKDEDGLGYKLTVNSNVSETDRTQTKYTITDKSGNTMCFNGYGNIISINEKKSSSAKITFLYESISTSDGTVKERLKSITDGAGRAHSFYYTASNSLALSYIKDPAQRNTVFTISGGNLTNIKYPDEKNVNFTYSDNKLSKITNFDGISAEIAYKSDINNIMAASISEKSSTEINENYLFDYFQNETVVTDKQNRKFTYQFNSFGQPTGIVSDADKTALGFSYAPGNTTAANANRILSSSRVQKSVENFVSNPSFNSGNISSYSLYEPNASGDYTTVGYDSSYGHYSNGSFKISRTAANGSWTDIDQHIKNLPAGTYTASAFISTNGNTVTNEKGVFAVQIVTNGTVTATYRCEPVTYTAAGEWARRSITVTISANQYIKVLAGITDSTTKGTFWIDDIQLEKASGVSSFNLVSNSTFHNNSNDWVAYSGSAVTSASTLSGFAKQMTFSPKSDGECRLRQYISYNGKVGDVFSFGAWVKADSVPIELQKNLVTPEKKAAFELRLELYNNDSVVCSSSKSFNPHVSSWQFISGELIADKAFNKVKISIIYNNNCNTISTTGIYVLAEEYGQSYTYDKQGNLISSADVTSSISSYGFTGGNLSAVKNPTGSNILFAYAESTNLLGAALSTNG